MDFLGFMLGTVISLQSVVTGSGAATLPALTASGSGGLESTVITGSGSAALPSAEATGAGGLEITWSETYYPPGPGMTYFDEFAHLNEYKGVSTTTGYTGIKWELVDGSDIVLKSGTCEVCDDSGSLTDVNGSSHTPTAGWGLCKASGYIFMWEKPCALNLWCEDDHRGKAGSLLEGAQGYLF